MTASSGSVFILLNAKLIRSVLSERVPSKALLSVKPELYLHKITDITWLSITNYRVDLGGNGLCLITSLKHQKVAFDIVGDENVTDLTDSFRQTVE